jgi:hypothetical protein
LKVGTGLNQNSVIRTAPGSTVDLYLNENGPAVRVTENTTLGLDRLTIDRTGVDNVIETQLDLRNGRILGNVRKLAAASKYEVKTPMGVAGIRGTRYDIRADGTVAVTEGSVVVVYIVGGQATKVTVTAGNMVRPPTTPGAPVTPIALTPQQIADINNNIPPVGGVQRPSEVAPSIVTVTPLEEIQKGDPIKNTPELPTSPTTPTTPQT